MDHSRVHVYNPLDPFSFSRPSRPRHDSVSNVDEINPVPLWNRQTLEAMKSMPDFRSSTGLHDTRHSQSANRSHSLDPEAHSAHNHTYQGAPLTTPSHTLAPDPASERTTNAKADHNHEETVNSNVNANVSQSSTRKPNGASKSYSNGPNFPLNSDHQIRHHAHSHSPIPSHPNPYPNTNTNPHSTRRPQSPHHTPTLPPHGYMTHVPFYSPSQCPYLSRPRQHSVNSEIIPTRERSPIIAPSSPGLTIRLSPASKTIKMKTDNVNDGDQSAGIGIEAGAEAKTNSNTSSTTLNSQLPIHERMVTFLIYILPTQIYLHCLLRLPYMYFSRVTQIFQDADMTLEEIKEMVLRLESEDKLFRNDTSGYHDHHHGVDRNGNGGCGCESCSYQRFYYGYYGHGYGYGYGYHRGGKKEPKSYTKLKNTWEDFIECLMKEWKTLNIVSALMISGILTVFQIEGADEDPITRYAAFWSSICALLSLLYGCIFIIRFSNMKKPTKALEWALVSQQDTKPFWNVWVMLSMPVVWLAWSIIAYILCIMSLMWRVRRDSEGSLLKQHLPPNVDFGLRIFVSGTFGLGVIYAFGIIFTLKNYGTEMDKAWRRRIQDYANKISMELQPQSQSQEDQLNPQRQRMEPSPTTPVSEHSNRMQEQMNEQRQRQRRSHDSRVPDTSDHRNQNQGQAEREPSVPTFVVTKATPKMGYVNTPPHTPPKTLPDARSSTPASPSLHTLTEGCLSGTLSRRRYEENDIGGPEQSSLFYPYDTPTWATESPASLSMSSLSCSNYTPPGEDEQVVEVDREKGKGKSDNDDDDIDSLALISLPPSSSTPKTKIRSMTTIDNGDRGWDGQGVSSCLSIHTHSGYYYTESGDSPVKGRRGHKNDDSGQNSPILHRMADLSASLDGQTVIGTPPNTISKASGSNETKNSPQSNLTRQDSTGSNESSKSSGSKRRKSSGQDDTK